MTELLLDARQAAALGPTHVGGKAAGLARLTMVNAPVPEWRVLSVGVFDEHLERAGVQQSERAPLDPPAARRVRDAIRSTPLAPNVIRAITELGLGDGPLAVRSSVVGEDGHRNSYAGIFESYLYCQGIDAVGNAIKECWASAFGERALAYRAGRQLPPQAPGVGVVLQRMVDGDVSGVIFTANPTTGAAGEAVISACWGLGEGIVGGVCSTDEFTVSHQGVEQSVVLADKDVMVVRGAAGTKQVPVPADRRGIRCLSPEKVNELLREALRIADALGEAQDAEWAFHGAELAILQTRPITASPSASLGEWRTVWDNSNIQESFNGVTLPLTFSWASAVYRAIFREVLRMLGARSSTVDEYEPVLRNMIGLVSGRVYYNIDNWYRVLQFTPSFDRNKADVEKMLGVQHPVDFIEDSHLPLGAKLRRIPGMLPVVAALLWRLGTRRRANGKFQSEVVARLAEIDERRKKAGDLIELLNLTDEALTLFRRWAVPIFNDFYLSRQAGKVRRMIADRHDNADEVAAGLLAANEAIESIEPTLVLMRIAARIQSDPSWVATLDRGEPVSALQELSLLAPGVGAEIDEFVDRFGDRCMGEQKLETLSLRQDRTFLAKVLRNYVADPAVDAAAFESVQRERQRRFEAEILRGMPPLARRRLRKVLRGARDAIKARESMRLTRTRVVGAGRALYLDVGQRLHDAGHLENPRQVFCLTMDDIAAFAEGRAVTTGLSDLARLREAEFAGYAGEEPPNQFQTFGSPYGGRRTEHGEPVSDDDDVLRGSGCCPGEVEGEVRIVLSPLDDLAVAGKILTTVRTDPGWGPLFPGLAGLLVERGSTLSHSAVLARELGIPAVVGIPGLMAKVSDGEIVRLDGRTGVVRRSPVPERSTSGDGSGGAALDERLRAVVCARLGVADIDADHDLLDYGLDSVRKAELEAEIEDVFGVHIDDEEAAELLTLNQLAAHIAGSPRHVSGRP